MAYSAFSQVPIAFPMSSISRRSVFKSNNATLCNKSRASSLSLDLKIAYARSRSRFVVCTSAQEATKSKVAVSPLTLEDAKEPPLQLYSNKEPYTATVVSIEKLVGQNAPAETYHIVSDHGGNVPYWEGQSYGVIIPGEGVRLYSLASSRYGDSFNGKTASLCVRRAGGGGTFLTDLKSGDKIKITGPSGKTMLLPEDDPNANHVMIATGTGVAPYRGHLRRMFMEDVPTFKFGGLAWLFLEVENKDSLLYDNEFSGYLEDNASNFRYDRVLSQEQKNESGGEMHVQDKIEEYSDEIFGLLDGGAHIYFCGSKGMMPGIQDALKRVAAQRGESWDEKLSQLKKNNQWHAEVY